MMKALICAVLVLVVATVTSAFVTPNPGTLEREARTYQTPLERLIDSLAERAVNKVERLLAFKRNQDEDELRSFLKSYFDTFCDEGVDPAEYLTPDVKLNFAGEMMVGYEQLGEVFSEMEADGETCFIEDYEITRLQIVGDSAIAMIEETREMVVDAAHKGQVVNINGVETKLETEEDKDQVSLELVREEGKWRINAGFFFLESATPVDD